MTNNGLAKAALALAVGSASASNQWFPDWNGGTGNCLEASSATPPLLFSEHDGFYESTMNSCCARYFDGDAEAHCIAQEAQNHTGTGRWYVAWNDDPSRCAKDCPVDFGDPSCGGVQGSGAGTTYADVASCCSNNFQYLVSDYCVTISQEEEYLGSNDWYLDSRANMCVRDCGGDAPCGGVVKETWQTLYETDALCCAGALPSLDPDFCLGLGDSTHEGTNKWFVSGQLCKKDCQGTGDECAAATSHDDLYDDASACCAAKLGWMNSDYCESRSDPATYGTAPAGAAYTGKWFVDYSAHLCVNDCGESGNPACGDLSGNPQSLFDTAAACCSDKLGYLDADVCAASSAAGEAAESTGTGKWYADYQSKKHCVLDCDASGALCGGIVSRSNGIELYDSAAECCEARFGWYDPDLCAAMSDGTEVTGKWYVDYQDNVCVSDCPTSGGAASCAGTPQDWGTPMFETAALCCSNKLQWMDNGACVTKSENGADSPTAASNKFYADYSKNYCVKDCAESSADAACMGLVDLNLGHQLYDTAAACCDERFGYVNSQFCEAKSASGGQSNTQMYYASQQDKVCHRDCPATSGGACNGPPAELSARMFDDVAECCSEMLGWINAASCAQVPEADQGTEEWYVDWQLTKCVKNCPASKGNECGGMAESYEDLYQNSNACCARLNWLEDDDCRKS